MSGATALTHLSLIETADGIASGAFSAEAVTRACLERIEAAQPPAQLFHLPGGRGGAGRGPGGRRGADAGRRARAAARRAAGP